jgi:hypothetical protein
VIRRARTVLANISRDGNILSEVIRSAYDHGNLHTLTIKPRHAAGTHVLIVVHVTPEELRKRLDDVALANGFGNRFLWFYVRSDKVLPRTRPIPAKALEPFVGRFRALARTGGPAQQQYHAVPLDAEAARLWDDVYRSRLRRDRPGLAGAMVARAAPMVMRLALTYAALECPLTRGKLVGIDLKKLRVGAAHLQAALAVWDYCEASAYRLFGERAGDPLGDKVLELLAHGPLPRGAFKQHLSVQQKAALPLTLAKLQAAGQVRRREVNQDGPGRPTEVWERTEPGGVTEAI